jgi:SAM-dependent methyltransferase
VSQYDTDRNLALRQRLWAVARREPAAFDLFGWVLDLCALSGDERILDVGCGNGAYERALVARGHTGQVAALDLSLGMRPHLVADAQALPFPADTFGVVLAPHMLYHVPDVPLAAAEVRRALRADGVFVAVTNGDRSMRELRALVEEAVGTGWRMVQPATASFSLENGGPQLTAAFASVELVEVPPSWLLVDDADVIAGYVASVPEYGDETGTHWPDVVDRVRASAASVIERDGAVRFSTSTGAFVCR